MRIALASDHAGFSEKEKLKPLLTELGVEYFDLGTTSEASVDYPDYARKVAEEVATGKVDQGLLVCGSGTGMAITANKVPVCEQRCLVGGGCTTRAATQRRKCPCPGISDNTSGEIPKIIRARGSKRLSKADVMCNESENQRSSTKRNQNN
jgi:hypothetical protein